MHRDVDLVHDSVVDVADDSLNDLELLEQSATGVKNIL